jgi:DNA-binding beta-propeller fold protein YncE
MRILKPGETMKRQILSLLTIFLALLATGMENQTSSASPSQVAKAPRPGEGRIVIANRASGTISVINVDSDEVLGTFALPAGPNPPEPMYVVGARRRVLVGDRANSRIVVFNARNFGFEASVPAGAGVFHMWMDPLERQLWVNNDIDKTATVIDPITLEVLATVPMPADLVASGGKPHDIILDPTPGHQFAYITMIGVAGPFDYVVKYSTRTFEEIGRAAVGKDPHVSAARQNRLLYVTCQGSSVVLALNRENLAQVASIPVPGAHGAGMARSGATFYTTNLPGGGIDGIWTIDTRTNSVVTDPLDTPFAAPHNIALTPDGSKLYLTHSAATLNKVTIYRLEERIPVFHKEVTVGFNPFGIAYIP